MEKSSLGQAGVKGKLIAEIKKLVESKNTLQLATVDENGKPNASYAPFVSCDDGYYILISEMARHAQNILINPTVSLMVIEDESQADCLHSRKRLTLDATAILISTETERWSEVTKVMIEKLGETVKTLVQLSDFHLIHLQPEQGLYVKGFGKAHHVAFNELFNPVVVD
ncbi:pyridoxamine 5'-phosphate oxidase family protein [Psychromonas algicola]|uniref:pyridoxamine 5'-phosphate oxidase family protein n=1 Tax=Psychromonas algicola TaxID=2555642 RepID=UPI001067FEFF|nr:pyridoxamine 5'-phosphate oxidase family protein [Psychromonas sp. RZ5]TEW52183.1 heme utilization protein HutZ [Psychromonas sp. RZ5]